MQPPLGDDCFHITAGVQSAENPSIRSTDDVENAVRKTVKDQASHFAKTDGIKLCATHTMAVAGKKILGKLQPQTGLLVFIPIVGIPQVSADERMSYEHGHRRIRGTFFRRQLR